MHDPVNGILIDHFSNRILCGIRVEVHSDIRQKLVPFVDLEGHVTEEVATRRDRKLLLEILFLHHIKHLLCRRGIVRCILSRFSSLSHKRLIRVSTSPTGCALCQTLRLNKIRTFMAYTQDGLSWTMTDRELNLALSLGRG